MRSQLVLLPCRLVSFSRNSLRFLVFHFERTLIPSSPPELASPPLLRSRLGSPRTLQIAPIPSSSGSRPSTSAVPHLFRPLRLSGSTFRHFLRDSFSAPLQLLSRLLLPLHPSPERPARRPVRAILCLSPFMSCCLPPRNPSVFQREARPVFKSIFKLSLRRADAPTLGAGLASTSTSFLYTPPGLSYAANDESSVFCPHRQLLRADERLRRDISLLQQQPRA
jgi:hypothetical protein